MDGVDADIDGTAGECDDDARLGVLVSGRPVLDERWQRWNEAYSAHAPAMRAFAQRCLASPTLAEDVTQDVFLRLWTRPDSFDPELGSLRSYLLTLTRWRCVDLIRAEESRRKRERQITATDGLRGTVHQDEEELMAERKHAAEVVRDALVVLPPEERLPIDLAYFGEMTYRDVAEVLEWPEGTVKSRMRRALGRLRHYVFAQLRAE